jgi:hypothetical protein
MEERAMGKRWGAALGLLAAFGLAACLTSCTQGDAVKAASTIHAYLPAVVGLANDAAAIAGELDPAESSTLQALSTRVQTELQELETVSGAYAAAPSADGWTRMGAVVDSLVSDADEGLLAALAIKDPASQAKAKVALSALDAAMHVVDGYMMAARTPQQAKAVAVDRAALEAKELRRISSPVLSAQTRRGEGAAANTLLPIARYWSKEERRSVALAFGVSDEDLAAAEMRSGF